MSVIRKTFKSPWGNLPGSLWTIKKKKKVFCNTVVTKLTSSFSLFVTTDFSITFVALVTFQLHNRAVTVLWQTDLTILSKTDCCENLVIESGCVLWRYCCRLLLYSVTILLHVVIVFCDNLVADSRYILWQSCCTRLLPKEIERLVQILEHLCK